MSWGKHFSSMYEGSMYGAGAMVFAVWGYVLSNMRPENVKDRNSDMIVELNAKKLADTLGEQPTDVEAAIGVLCSPDAKSRSTEEGGRRLIDLGAFLFKVVNGRRYREIRDEAERRESCRLAMARLRQKKNPHKRTPQPGEGLVARGADPGETADMVNRERGFGGGI